MASRQVRIQLFTKDDALQFLEKPGPFLVPTDISKQKLTQLVNTLLDPAQSVSLDFLVDGHFLATSIESYLTNNGISAENVVNVEYIRALAAPQHTASFQHDDWVGAVDVLSASSSADTEDRILPGQERILSGSYDGLLRVFNASGDILATSKPLGSKVIPHVVAAKWFSPTAVVAPSSDARLHVWTYTETDDFKAALTPTVELRGHKKPVSALAVNAASRKLLSASADTTVKLWSPDVCGPRDTNGTHSDDAKPTKRRKVSSSSAPAAPLLTLAGHARKVTDVCFHPHDATAAYTSSEDRTLRTWDLTTGACVSTRTPWAHVQLLSLAPLAQLNLLATGTVQRRILLTDPRESATRSTVLTFTGHRNSVVALAPDPASEFRFVSGSHDGTCRIWDVRNSRTGELQVDSDTGSQVSRAVHKIPRQSNPACERVVGGEGVKVFSVVWDGQLGIVSGSEDRRVQIDGMESVRSSAV